MVYTVTLNPSIDCIVYCDTITDGSVNRANRQEIRCGGKGINVSAVLTELGIDNVAIGFTAGFTGNAIEEALSNTNINSDFIRLNNGLSRINIKLKSDTETEINSPGPQIDDKLSAELLTKIQKIKSGDTVVLAGSIPPSLPKNFYEKILDMLSDKKIRAVVDATGEALLNTLKYKPFLIKPNRNELCELFGLNSVSTDDIIKYSKKLKEMGAENVLVSMGKDGAVLIDGFGKIHSCGVCKGSVKNSVGAGDSMVAGFIGGAAGGDYDYALKLATACGSAAAFSDGLARKKEIHELLKQL